MREKKTDKENQEVRLKKVRADFISQWGVMGTQWGINRTMAQIHALLMTNSDAMSTDEVMEVLQVSRGNAHSNLKELVSWGLLKIVTKKGDRREYFLAEKNVWEMFRRISVERKRREIDPILNVLRNCLEETQDVKTGEGEAFYSMIKELEEFVSFAAKMTDRVAAMQHGKAMQLAIKMFA